MSETVSLKEAQLQIQQKMAALKEELKTLGEKLFREGAQEIFDAYPNLVSFSWDQYTPYFNDGDECVFSVHDYNIKGSFTKAPELGEDFYTEEKDEGEYYIEKPYRSSDKELTPDEEAVLAAFGLIEGIDADTMKALFGDHVEVVVTREGIDTEYCEHD